MKSRNPVNEVIQYAQPELNHANKTNKCSLTAFYDIVSSVWLNKIEGKLHLMCLKMNNREKPTHQIKIIFFS